MSCVVPTVKVTLSAAPAGAVATTAARPRPIAATARPARRQLRCCIGAPPGAQRTAASWHIRSTAADSPVRTRSGRGQPPAAARDRRGRWRRRVRRSWAIAATTLSPGMPVTPPPPWVAPTRPGTGPRSACGSRRSRARAACGTAAPADSSPWKMLPPTRPYVCSMSYGPITWRWRIESVKPGRDRLHLRRSRGRRRRRARRGAGSADQLARHPLREHRHHVLALRAPACGRTR